MKRKGEDTLVIPKESGEALTLRDQLAMAALQGILARGDRMARRSTTAQLAYDMADAMIAERSNPGDRQPEFLDDADKKLWELEGELLRLRNYASVCKERKAEAVARIGELDIRVAALEKSLSAIIDWYHENPDTFLPRELTDLFRMPG